MRKLTFAFGIAAIAAAFQVAYAADRGAPYDQLEIDLALPQVSEPTGAGMAGDSSRAPYEPLDIDRAVPQFPEQAVDSGRKAVERGAPYDQLDIDRAVPQFPDKAGDSKTTSEAAPGSESIWEHDD